MLFRSNHYLGVKTKLLIFYFLLWHGQHLCARDVRNFLAVVATKADVGMYLYECTEHYELSDHPVIRLTCHQLGQSQSIQVIRNKANASQLFLNLLYFARVLCVVQTFYLAPLLRISVRNYFRLIIFATLRKC